MATTLRIGLWLGGKQKQWEAALRSQASDWAEEHGVVAEVAAVDLQMPLEEQKFDVVLHKLCSHFALEGTDPVMAAELARITEYFDTHPGVAFDPITATRELNDRYVLCQKLQGINVQFGDERVVQPPYCAAQTEKDVAKMIQSMSFDLPWICKPFVADGVPQSHDLAMIVRPEGLYQAKLPFIVQPFINHDAQILKVYVLGDTITQLRRPSLPNTTKGPVSEGPAFVPFGRISNAGGDKEKDCKVLPENESSVPEMSQQLLKLVVREMIARLDVRLFGVDFIRDRETGHYMIIDVNYLPGYYGVPNVFEQLLDMMLSKKTGKRE